MAATERYETPVIAGVVLRDDVRPHDVELIRELADFTGFFTPAEVDVAVELVQERLARGAASGYLFLIAEMDGRGVGYSCYGPIACTVGSYDLYWIVVHQADQRRGLGRLLMRETEKRIAQAGGRAIYVDTAGREQYAPTRAFYERCGYKIAAALPDFYTPGDAKIIYAKTLSPGRAEGTLVQCGTG